MQPLDARDVHVRHSVYWAELERRLAPLFAQSEAQSRALASGAGLLSPAERKNGWQRAEITSDNNPYGCQHLLGRASWQPDALQGALRSHVLNYLSDETPVGVIDETGFFKKGRRSIWV